jgi:hypothetical protein
MLTLRTADATAFAILIQWHRIYDLLLPLLVTDPKKAYEIQVLADILSNLDLAKRHCQNYNTDKKDHLSMMKKNETSAKRF